MSAVVTKKHIAQVNTQIELKQPRPGMTSNIEMDSNADTCCAGASFIVISMTRRTADVFPYDSNNYQPIHNVPIVTAATAYDDPNTNETYILVLHECLYYGMKLEHSLLNPNQLRHFGVDVWDNAYDPNHAISIECHDDNLTIPLSTRGTKVYFTTRSPTEDELNRCHHISLTSEREWNPDQIDLSIRAVQATTHPLWSTRRQISAMNVGYPEGTTIQYEYSDVNNEHSLLHQIEPSLVCIGELISARQKEESSYTMADIPARRSFVSNERHKGITALDLAESWGIGPKQAKATLLATTQRGTRSAILPLSRRYRADKMYRMKRLNTRFSTDTLYSDVKSLNQNTCAQVYSTKFGFSAVYPMIRATGDTIGQSYVDFSHDFGIPEHLTFDGAVAQTGKGTLFMKSIKKFDTQYHVSSPRRPNENPVESTVREIKKKWYRIMIRQKVPKRLWDFGFVWICEISNLTVSSSRYAHGRTPIEILLGDTPDISEYLDFCFYDWVSYRPNPGVGESVIGRWIGVSHKIGQLMSYWILTIAGHVVSCTDVQRLTKMEQETSVVNENMLIFNDRINKAFDIKVYDLSKQTSSVDRWNMLSIDQFDEEFAAEMNRVIDDAQLPHAKDDNIEIDVKDNYLNIEIGLPRGDDGTLHHATVKRRKVDDEGEPLGTPHNNPILDSRQYEVEFMDGTVEVLTANVIAENLLAQVDEEGHRQLLLDEIIDFRKDDTAVRKDDCMITTKNGIKRKAMTTRGWELCVIWKDGSTDWVSLKDLKESYPVELAQFAINNKIQDEPAFAWWVPYVIRKKDVIISKVKSKYWQRTHKFGLRIPKSVKEAYQIDEENRNTHWRDAIKEEMSKVRVAFEETAKSPDELYGYEEITVHMVFDVKMGENFRRKARLVADGHKTKPPSSVTYSSVVSRDSVRICLLIAALNDLDVLAGDIENAYLTAPNREKKWTRAGPEFGHEEEKVFIITRALYGLKSAGASFRAFLAERLDEMGFRYSIADPDVWMRPATKNDGEGYYEYVLVYVDDILTISTKAKEVMLEVAQRFKFKKDRIEPPEIYLGGRLENKKLGDRRIWTLTSKDYLKAAIDNLEQRLEKMNMKLTNKAFTPMVQSYKPELDESDELDSNGITMYQELIGELRWAIELGRVDILHEISILSTYQASPRQGHLEQLLHIFAFLKHKIKLTLYFDPQEPIIDESAFVNSSSAKEFKEQYRDAEEELPKNMPVPRGKHVVTTGFVDASHAPDRKTRRSHTGFVLFVNRAPIVWYSKRQSTVESSTFSSELIALKICMEHVVALRFKLRMFGVPIDGETKILCDNKSAVTNCSQLESTLHKKHNSLAYHAVRWSVAAGIIKVGWIDTNFNIADAFTKRLTVAQRDRLFGDWTY